MLQRSSLQSGFSRFDYRGNCNIKFQTVNTRVQTVKEFLLLMLMWQQMDVYAVSFSNTFDVQKYSQVLNLESWLHKMIIHWFVWLNWLQFYIAGPFRIQNLKSYKPVSIVARVQHFSSERKWRSLTCLLDSLRLFLNKKKKKNTAPVHYRKPYYENRISQHIFSLSELHTIYFF